MFKIRPRLFQKQMVNSLQVLFYLKTVMHSQSDFLICITTQYTQCPKNMSTVLFFE